MKRILFTAGVLVLLAALIVSGQTHTFCALDLSCTVTGAWTFSNLGASTITGQLTSTVSTGTAPFSIASTTVVPNLNAQLHNGLTAPGSAIVGVSDTQTLTNKSLTSPALTTPTIGGETVSQSPRGAFSGSAPGLTASGRVMQMPPDKAITVSSISYTVPPGGTVGVGCTQAPQVRVTDGTTLSSTLTLSNSAGSGSLTGLSVNYAAGADLRLEVAFNASGCGTNWTNVNFVVQFRMQ